MKRLTLMVIVCVVLLGMSSLLTSSPGAQAQGLPTNTRRAIPTNTPRRGIPDMTLVPTRTRIPTDTATFTPSATATKTDTPTEVPTLTPSITPTTIGPFAYPDNINSLTGLPFPGEDARNRRNLIVKISNYPWMVRPQAGLSLADIVYEYEVEGGVTRFAAIFRSNAPDFVGSIRSARLPDLELVVMYNALLAYSGANDNIRKMIGEAPWKRRALTPQWGDNCPPFCRFPRPGLPFEHTLFGSTVKMWELADRRGLNEGYPGRGFAFDDTPGEGGVPTNDIYIKWYGDQDARWQYNPTDRKYYRWNTGLPHIDIAVGKQIAADNVVIIQATHEERPDVYESESGAQAVEIQLWGTEQAWVFRDGRWYEGIWVRRNRTREGSALVLYTPDRKTPIFLKPGNTWVEVVRCCNMFGVEITDQYINAQATAVFAAGTATARAPKPSAVETQATAQALNAAATNVVSAATNAVTTTPIFPPVATSTP